MKRRLIITGVLSVLLCSIAVVNNVYAWSDCSKVPGSDQKACDIGNLQGLYNNSASLNNQGMQCNYTNGSAQSACVSGVNQNVYNYLRCNNYATQYAKKLCGYIAAGAATELINSGTISSSWDTAKAAAEQKIAENDPSNGNNGGNTGIVDAPKSSCASILTAFCDEDGTSDMGGIIGMVITILTGTIVVAGTIGIILCGFMWMTARDNEAQVAKAKKRMFEIVVGIAAWVLLILLANLLLPRKSEDIEENVKGNTGIEKVKAVEKPQTTTSAPASGTNTATNTATTPVTPLNENSSNIACAAGTTDLGVTNEAYYQGNKITIRLCSVSSIKSTSAEDSDHHAHVNSRVSGAYYALGKKYQETHNGATLSVSQSFRTYAKQQYFYNCYINQNCNNGNQAARPGYSNHQLGTALDFVMDGSGWGNTGISGFFNQYLGTYGLKRGVTDEDWHVSP